MGIQRIVTEKPGDIGQTDLLLIGFQKACIFQHVIDKNTGVFFMKDIADIIFAFTHIRAQIVIENVRPLKPHPIGVRILINNLFQIIGR